MESLIIEIIVFISSLISFSALLLGIIKFFKKDIPGFFVLTICSVACSHLQDLHTAIGYLCDDSSTGLTISTIAIFGCFMFFLSASIGPIDKLIEKTSLKIKCLSLIAPVIMAVLLIISLIIMYPLVDTATFVITIIFYLPSLFVSYYVLKHVLSNDETGIYQAIRGCNIIILVNVLLNMLYLIFSVFSVPVMLLIIYASRSVLTLVLIFETIRGYKKWKTLL